MIMAFFHWCDVFSLEGRNFIIDISNNFPHHYFSTESKNNIAVEIHQSIYRIHTK